MGLQAPPKTETPSRLAARFLTLLIFAAGAGIVIYTAVTNQRADLTEDIRPINLELDDTTVVGGFVTNLRIDDGGPAPVLILHDVDVTGGLILEDLSAALPDTHHGVRLDLPGFGYSTRMPEPGPEHTVAGLADRIVRDERVQPAAIVDHALGDVFGRCALLRGEHGFYRWPIFGDHQVQ